MSGFAVWSYLSAR